MSGRGLSQTTRLASRKPRVPTWSDTCRACPAISSSPSDDRSLNLLHHWSLLPSRGDPRKHVLYLSAFYCLCSNLSQRIMSGGWTWPLSDVFSLPNSGARTMNVSGTFGHWQTWLPGINLNTWPSSVCFRVLNVFCFIFRQRPVVVWPVMALKSGC